MASLARAGENLLLADTLAEQVAKHAKMMLSRVRTVAADELKSLVAAQHHLGVFGHLFGRIVGQQRVFTNPGRAIDGVGDLGKAVGNLRWAGGTIPGRDGSCQRPGLGRLFS